MRDFAAMTIDELDAHSVKLKGQIEAIRDERRVAKGFRDDLVMRESLSRQLTKAGQDPVDTSGLSINQVRDLLGIARATPPRPGDVVVTPATGAVDLTGVAPDAVATNDSEVTS